MITLVTLLTIAIMNVEYIDTDFDFNDCECIAFLNGQPSMHETEAALFKKLSQHNYTNIICIDNLFEYPKRLKVLPIMNVDTIVLGTTGTYKKQLDSIFEAFKNLSGYQKQP